VGPGLGGLVADHASWRFVFIGLTPVALLCAVLTVPALRRLAKKGRSIPEHGDGTPIGFAVQVATGSALLLLALRGR
jgi:MFS family permease